MKKDKIMSEDYEILPAVLVIHPSGYTEFLDADVSSMTSGEIESLIYGEDLEVVHLEACSMMRNLM